MVAEYAAREVRPAMQERSRKVALALRQAAPECAALQMIGARMGSAGLDVNA